MQRLRMLFDEVIAVQLSDSKRRSVGNELTSVYVRQIDFRLQMYEQSSGAEKEIVVDLSEEGEPRSVYRIKISENCFKKIAAEQRIRTSFDNFPEIITSFACQANEKASSCFFSCCFPTNGQKKSVQFELTQHDQFRSSSILTLSLDRLQGEDLIEYLAQVIKKELKEIKDANRDLKKENHDLIADVIKYKQEKEAAVEQLRNGQVEDCDVENLMYELQKHRDDKGDYEKELDERMKEIDVLNEANDELLREAEKLFDENEELTKEKQCIEEKFEDLKETYEELKGTHEELKKGYEEVYETYSNVLTNEEKLASTLRRVAEDKYHLSEENKQLQTENQRLSAKCDDLRKRFQTIAASLNAKGRAPAPKPANITPQ